jgi:hypothetical protein
VSAAKIPEPEKLRERRIYFHLRFQRFSPWLLSPRPLGKTSLYKEHMEEEAVHLVVDKKQREERAGDQLQRRTPSDPLLLSRTQLPTFPPPPKLAPRAGDQAINT